MSIAFSKGSGNINHCTANHSQQQQLHHHRQQRPEPLLLASIHINGSIKIWEIPSGICRGIPSLNSYTTPILPFSSTMILVSFSLGQPFEILNIDFDPQYRFIAVSRSSSGDGRN